MGLLHWTGVYADGTATASAAAEIDQLLATAKLMFAQTFAGPETEKGLQDRFEAVAPLLAVGLAGKTEDEAQLLVEEFLMRMEVALREKAKVGDMGMGKRMRAYGGALNGRLQRYGQLLANQDRTGMAVALAEHGVLGADALLGRIFSDRSGV